MLKKLKYVYVVLLLLLPAFVIKVLFEQSVDVATVKINNTTLTTPEAGSIYKINAVEGQPIPLDYTLLQMESTTVSTLLNLVDQSIESLNKNHRQEVGLLKQQLAQAKAALSFQRGELDRYKKFMQSGAVSLMMLADALASYNNSRLAYDGVANAIINAESVYQLKHSELVLSRINLVARLDSLNITTKESGVVSKVLVKQGQQVNIGAPLMILDAGYSIIVHTNKILNKKVRVKFGWKFVQCTTSNVSNQENNITLITLTADASIYLLQCGNIDKKFQVDNQTFYIFN